MGCDIHLMIEQKNTYSGDEERQVQEALGISLWTVIDTSGVHYLNNPAGNRNYARFAALAGVRGDGPDARGTPEDMSPATAHEISQWGGDGHSHSHLPAIDFIDICEEAHWKEEDPLPYTTEATFADLCKFWFGVRLEGDEDLYRIVFWFDN